MQAIAAQIFRFAQDDKWFFDAIKKPCTREVQGFIYLSLFLFATFLSSLAFAYR